MSPPPVTPYPSKEQELLLQAALSENGNSLSAWETWSRNWNIEDYLDHGSFRLLPLLYRNLARQNVEDHRMMMLKGVYKQAWYKNLSLFNDSKKFLHLFEKNNIPTILLKGTALTVLYYKDNGVRPMADIDVMIPEKFARRGIEILKANGWKAEFDEYIEYNLRHGRSMMFFNDDGFEFDLHWFPFFESLGEGSDADFWDHAVPVDFCGFQSQALCPADNLLHTIIHGVKWNPEPPIRWVADSMIILRSSDNKIDWERFLMMTRKFRLVLQVREAFSYLVRCFNAPVPDSVLQELNNTKVSLSERLVYRYDKKNPDSIPDNFIAKLKMLFVIFLRQSDRNGFFRQMSGFVKYLMFRIKGKNPLKILKYYVFKTRITGRRG